MDCREWPGEHSGHCEPLWIFTLWTVLTKHITSVKWWTDLLNKAVFILNTCNECLTNKHPFSKCPSAVWTRSLYITGHIINTQNKTNTSQHTASHLHCVRRHTVVPSWQNTKCALLSHTLETAECRSQCVSMTHSCAHSPEWCWATEVTAWQIRG